MKLRLLAVLLCTLAIAAIAQEKAAPEKSIAGQWNIHISVGGTERDFSCNFTQADKDLKGTCGELGELTGKAAGDVFSWATKGGQAALNFSGKLAADGKTMTGTVDVPEYGVQGDFQASPAK